MTSNRAPFSPTVYRIPQLTSHARQRAREATLRQERAKNAIEVEVTADDLQRLPAHSPAPPKAELFSAPKKARLLSAKLIVRANRVLSQVLDPRHLYKAEDYARLFRRFDWPDEAYRTWNDDDWFAAQRLRGVNPMQLERVDSWPPPWAQGLDLSALEAAATAELRDLPKSAHCASSAWHGLAEVASEGRLFATRYHHLASPKVFTSRAKAALAAPTVLFLLDGAEQLRPLGIQLRPPDPSRWPNNPAFRPNAASGASSVSWRLARAHVQAADAHYHQGIFHLLETHLVNEAIAICIARELHPHHPLRQLLEPHYIGTLAINDVARHNLLTANGPIDQVMCAGVDAVLNLARLWYASWHWKERSFPRDLQSRGVASLPGYRYAEDGTRLWRAIHTFAGRVLRPWYSAAAPGESPDPDRDVREDTELAGFLRAVGDPLVGNVRGFPAQVTRFDELVELVAEMIFRAGPQHAAVNNGQFDNYGWIPNAPGTVYADLPDTAEGFRCPDYFTAMPGRDACHAQLGMVWVLSDPTQSTILDSGDAPAFRANSCFEASEAVEAFRRELGAVQATQERLNAHTRYLYLMPQNVSRSTDI